MYIDDLVKGANVTFTEKGALTLRTTTNPLVDFFALAGATRGNEEHGLDLFKKAFAKDREKAVRILFYLRDVRGGQGERQLFKNCLRYLSENEPEVGAKLYSFVPEYGRWDDLFVLDSDLYVEQLKGQLEEDKNTDTPSLLAKWMPSENASSNKSRTMARNLAKLLGMNATQYRKMLSGLRKKISLVEQKMSKREFGTIEYEKVPSQASLKYRKAFKRNDEDRYTNYLNSVSKGEEKINTSTLYPYQVYEAVGTPAAEQLWANLPDYTQGKNAIVVADVSGSMRGRPMSVSVSLALYFAERNKGQFKDYFITFSEYPSLQKIQGVTLRDNISSIERADWSMTTDIEAVFNLLVDTAVKNETPPNEMPETIYIISDMEFDKASSGTTNYELIDQRYRDAGYERPNLVFWNVDARNKQVPVPMNENRVSLVSGYSPSAFKLAVENKTPEETMEEVINSERYNVIKL